jgi:hypothetical protein
VEHSLESVRSSWEVSRISISDGWKDQRNRPLINVIAMCPRGAMLLKVVEIGAVEKVYSFVVIILMEAIVEILKI